MKKKYWLLAFLGLYMVLFSSLHAQDYYDEYSSEYEGEYEDEGEDETMDCQRRPRLRFRNFNYQDDPTDELDRDASWPGRREDFLDQLFR